MGLLDEFVCILIAQGAAKLPEVKVGDTKRNPGLNPRPHSSSADRAEQQNFFGSPTLTFSSFLQFLDLYGCIVSHLKFLILEQINSPLKRV